jgi:hypothetical protein
MICGTESPVRRGINDAVSEKDFWHTTRVVIQWEGGYRFCVLIYLPETWSREKKPR